MDGEVPPTDTCILLRPWLQLTGWMYGILALIRLLPVKDVSPSQSPLWDAIWYSMLAWIGLKASFKTLRMNLVFLYFIMVTFICISDYNYIAEISRNWQVYHERFRSGGVEAANIVGFIAAPIVGLFAAGISFWMTRDYADAVDARAEEERRLLLAAVLSPRANSYGATGFAPFAGQGRRLGSQESNSE